MALLEICCYSTACACTAQEAGADRIELCAAPNEGGLTPSFGTLRQARARVTIPVHPIVRPRGGDFCYDETEFAVMIEDIRTIREMGFPGVVTGVLTEYGEVDRTRMSRIMAAAQGMAVTFHRAFDVCREPFSSLTQLGEMGVARVLTSGQKMSAQEGIKLIRELKRRGDSPIIMAGAGIRPSNLALFIEAGVEEIHSSAGHHTDSPMRHRNMAVNMASGYKADEYRRYQVDAHQVRAMKQALCAAGQR